MNTKTFANFILLITFVFGQNYLLPSFHPHFEKNECIPCEESKAFTHDVAIKCNSDDCGDQSHHHHPSHNHTHCYFCQKDFSFALISNGVEHKVKLPSVQSVYFSDSSVLVSQVFCSGLFIRGPPQTAFAI